MNKKILTAMAGAALGLSALTAAGGAASAAPARAHVSHPSRAAVTGMCGLTTTVPTYKHVIWILMENNSYGNIKGSSSAPYINSLLPACGYASNFHNISHASLDNYIGLTNGASNSALLPYDGDCLPSASCEVKTTNLFNQLAGNWRGYDESMPSACGKSDSGQYAPKHN
ncbi:MAG TPA: hypothetical protein VGS21_12755, partial [Acidimicrobiales bacterium]|nr:hypothetical protein [Acidimicrobiales bacterium]